jgi:carboxypeptidase D
VLPSVLEKIPVLIFAGDKDLICNYMGQESFIQSLTWNGGTGLGVCITLFIVTGAKLNFFLQEVETQTWTVGGAPAGTWVSSRNLTYVKVAPIRVSLVSAK